MEKRSKLTISESKEQSHHSAGPSSPKASSAIQPVAASSPNNAASSSTQVEPSVLIPVFKNTKRGKSFFKSADADRDTYLSRSEFEEALAEFAGVININVNDESSTAAATADSTSVSTSSSSNEKSVARLSKEQIDALFADTDVNEDGRVSYAEFAYRFCGASLPADAKHSAHFQPLGAGATNGASNYAKMKHSLSLQTPLKKVNSSTAATGATGGSILNPSFVGAVSASDIQFVKDGRLSVDDMRCIVEQLWLGGTRHYKSTIEFNAKRNTSACTIVELRRLMTELCRVEKDSAREKERHASQWSQLGSYLTTKDMDRLFFALLKEQSGGRSTMNNVDLSKATVDLTHLFEQAKLKPIPTVTQPKLSSAAAAAASPKKKKSTKKKKGAGATDSKSTSDDFTPGVPHSYTLQSMKVDNIRDFVSDQILQHMSTSVKCHPPLKHFGDAEIAQRTLAGGAAAAAAAAASSSSSSNSTQAATNLASGYRTHILLSERTKVKRIVRIFDPPTTQVAATASEKTNSTSNAATKDAKESKSSESKSAAAADQQQQTGEIIIFAVFRTEYTAMARIEYLYHARIRMDLTETVKSCEYKEKKNWSDGELDRYVYEDLFDNWSEIVGNEDEMEEMSIPQQLQ